MVRSLFYATRLMTIWPRRSHRTLIHGLVTPVLPPLVVTSRCYQHSFVHTVHSRFACTCCLHWASGWPRTSGACPTALHELLTYDIVDIHVTRNFLYICCKQSIRVLAKYVSYENNNSGPYALPYCDCHYQAWQPLCHLTIPGALLPQCSHYCGI